MFNGERQPTYRAVLVGIVALGVLLLFLCSLSRVVKLAGAALFFVPQQLGILQQVKSDQVRAIDLRTSPTPLEFTESGKYVVYTDSLDLLEITDQLAETRAEPWLVIRSRATGEMAPVEFIRRGVTVLDSPQVNGRALFTFEIVEPGDYLITHPTRQLALTLVPDYVTGNEWRIGLVVAAEFVIVGGLVALVFLPPYWRRKRERDEIRKRKRQAVDRVWQRLSEANRDKQT